MTTIKRYISVCSLVGAMLLAMSCSDKEKIDPVPELERVAVSLAPGVQGGYSVGTLKYGVYIFTSAQGQGDYRFLAMMSPFSSGSKLELTPDQLANADYRFLFIALPEGISEQSVITENQVSGSSVPVTGSSSAFEWDSIRINHPDTDLALNADYYYGITDMTGQQILDTKLVEGELDRMVGQVVYDFFKTTGTVDSPVGIDDGFTSVMDRVYHITVEYTGLTQKLKFDGNNKLVPDPTAGTYAFTDEMEIGHDPVTGEVALGEKSSGSVIEQYLPAGAESSLYKGAARVRGAYLFPATTGVTTLLTMHYYDTTPACGNAHEGEHDLENCYPQPTITLNLPRTGSLAVQSNMFTANKAGIPCNRVIEVPVDSSVGIDTRWDASQAVAPL